MAKTVGAQKAHRQSIAKKAHNQMWKKRIKNAVRTVSDIISAKPANADILKVELSKLQKTLDKAVKKEVIHRNKANRIKSKYAKKFSVQNSATEPKAKKTTSAKRGKSSK